MRDYIKFQIQELSNILLAIAGCARLKSTNLGLAYITRLWGEVLAIDLYFARQKQSQQYHGKPKQLRVSIFVTGIDGNESVNHTY